MIGVLLWCVTKRAQNLAMAASSMSLLAIRSSSLASTTAASAPPDLLGLLLACHQRIRTFIALAASIAQQTSASDAEVRDACQRCHRYFFEALPLHVLDEEMSLLPRLQQQTPALTLALQQMHAEHLQHGPQVQELCALLQAVANAPAQAPLRAQLAVVAANLQIEFAAHLQAEETEIFPWIAKVLSSEDQAAVMHELRSRRQPTP